MINGLGSDPRVLAGLVEHLHPHHRVVVYDPPAHTMRIRGHADAAARLMATLGVSRYAVLGVSWGGAVAQEMSHHHPTAVSHLILASTTPCSALLVMPSVLLARSLRLLGASRACLRQIAAILGWSSLAYIWRIRQPTLVVSGQDDTLVLSYNAHLLHQLITHSQLELVPDAGHLLVMDQPALVGDLVRSFLRRTEP